MLSDTLTITRDVTIRSLGQNRVVFRLLASTARPVIRVQTGSVVKLEGIEVTGGSGKNCSWFTATDERYKHEVPVAAGIESRGTLTLSDCAIYGNRGTGVRNYQGTLVINYTTIMDNSQAWFGGGLMNIDGDTLVEQSIISRNHACNHGGGVYHKGKTARLVIARSTVISHNTAIRSSAIHCGCSDTAPLDNVRQLHAAMPSYFDASRLVGVVNQAEMAWKDFPTKITMMDSTVERNGNAGTDYATIAVAGCNAVGIARTWIRDNQAWFAAGIGLSSDYAAAWIHNSTIEANRAKQGAGFWLEEASTLRLFHSAIMNNSATSIGAGAYIFSPNSRLEATATNFSGNNATEGGSHIYNAGIILLKEGTILDEGGDEKGIFNGNELKYVLPAPLGRYMTDIFMCEELRCATLSGPTKPCPKQPCNASLYPDIQGKYVSNSIQGYISAPYPPFCERGAYGNSMDHKAQDSSTCSGECPPSAFCPEVGTIQPIPCPNGSYSVSTGGYSPESCLACPEQTYLNTSTTRGHYPCKECPLWATTRPGANVGRDSCVCSSGFYGSQPGGHDCQECPSGTTCDGVGVSIETLVVKQRYWRPTIQSFPQECPYPDTCAGGSNMTDYVYDPNTTAACAPGRGLRGAFCMLCADANFVFNPSSQSCEAPFEQSATIIVLISLAVLAFMFEQLLKPLRRLISRKPERGKEPARRSNIRALWKAEQYLRRALWKAEQVSLRQIKLAVKKCVLQLKICISFYQIIVQMGSVYRTREPPPYRDLLEMINHFIDCAWPDLSQARLNQACLSVPSPAGPIYICDPFRFSLQGYPTSVSSHGQ